MIIGESYDINNEQVMKKSEIFCLLNFEIPTRDTIQGEQKFQLEILPRHSKTLIKCVKNILILVASLYFMTFETFSHFFPGLYFFLFKTTPHHHILMLRLVLEVINKDKK